MGERFNKKCQSTPLRKPPNGPRSIHMSRAPPRFYHACLVQIWTLKWKHHIFFTKIHRFRALTSIYHSSRLPPHVHMMEFPPPPLTQPQSITITISFALTSLQLHYRKSAGHFPRFSSHIYLSCSDSKENPASTFSTTFLSKYTKNMSRA